MQPRMSAQEKERRARDDANILKQAELIKADKQRFSSASGVITKELRVAQNIVGKPVKASNKTKSKKSNKRGGIK